MPLAHVMTLSRRHSAVIHHREKPVWKPGPRAAPARRGPRSWLKRFGDRLIFVRYRYDSQRQRRYTTVELIVDEQPWAPAPADSSSVTTTLDPASPVALQIGVQEAQLRARIKEAGGKWDSARGVWILPLRRARVLGLESRIVTA
jgi:hypothetical protein